MKEHYLKCEKCGNLMPLIDKKIIGIEDKRDWTNDNFVYGKSSAREMPIGWKQEIMDETYQLFDKFLCKIDRCYFCGSKNTFHARQQKLGDKIGNVWRMETFIDKYSILSKKWDFCLNCGREFLIEWFAFIKLKNDKKI